MLLTINLSTVVRRLVPNWWRAGKRQSQRARSTRLTKVERLEARELLTTITVTTNQDVVNSDDEFLSLREAVTIANGAAGADTIQFSPAANGTILLVNGELVITDTLSIEGNGISNTRLDARAASRVIRVTAESANLTLDGLSILNGRIDGESGGGVEFQSAGALSITDAVFSGNFSEFYGAAINSGNGQITLTDCDIVGNVGNHGTGVHCGSGSITLINSNISGNTAFNGGGGIYSNGASIELINSTVSGNTASYGGGIFSGNGSVTLTNSTVSGNDAAGAGGGIFISSGLLTLINSTVAYNAAHSETNGGGGILLFDLASSLIAKNSIIAMNSATEVAGPDVRQFNGGSITLTNSLLGNSAGTPLTPSATLDANGNLIGGTGNLAIDPLLGALGDNGGPTPTHALLINSPAIDKGSNATASELETDQRGLARVSGGSVDMGSFEVQYPVVNFSTDAASFSEVSGTIQVTVTLSEAFGLPVTIPFTVGGTAANPDDFTIAQSPLVIAAGQTSGTIAINLVDTIGFEPNETVVLTLGNVTNGIAGNVTSTTVTILDSSIPPTVTFSTATASANENAGTVVVTVNLSTASNAPVTIPFTVGGTASDPSDYSIDSSPLIIPAGQTSGTIEITLVDSETTEPNETVTLTMGSLTNATPGAITTTTLTIVDVAALPTVSFSASTISFNENDGLVSVVVNLSTMSSLATTIPFTVGGSASNPGDYTIDASPLVIPAGQTSGTIKLNLVDTVGYELTESVILTLGTPTNAKLGVTTTETVSILDLDAVPKVSFAESQSAVSEVSGGFAVTVNLSAPSAVATTIPFSVAAASTANNPGHYTIDASPLVIPAGATSGTILINLVNTPGIESAETVILDLGTPTNGSLGTLTRTTITILDDAVIPVVNFDMTTQSVSESIGVVNVTVKLSQAVGQVVTIPFSVSGSAQNPSDFTIDASPLIIPVGESAVTFQIAVVNDSSVEDDESIILTLGTPTNATLGDFTVDTVTIRDNDFIPLVSFNLATQNANETDATATLVVNLSGPSPSNVTIPFSVTGGTAASPADFTLAASPLVIPAGQTSGTITVSLVNDVLIEGSESIIVTLGPPTNGALGATTTTTLTILDNDFNTAPTLAAGQAFSVSENSPGGTIVGQVNATDTDVPAPFNTLTFSLASNPGNRFAISTGGQITVANGALLDFETTPTVTLSVTVSDGGSPALTATQDVTVTLTNVNEVPVLNDQTRSIAENSANGTNVGTPLLVDDPDVGQPRTFSITGGNTGSVFAIDSTTGQITVANSSGLNFETTPTFTLTVQVADDGNPALSDTATITINVTNINEPPVLAGGSGTVTLLKSQASVNLLPDVTVTKPEGGTTLGRLVISWFVQKKGLLTDVNLGNTQSLGVAQESGATDFRKAGGIHTVTITLNEGVTEAQVQAFLRGITFSTKKFDPVKKPLGRKIDVQVFDRQEVATPSNVLSTQIRAHKK